ncbi:hypothetical protein JCM10207_003073 [Rhodosporidiobolus poonsookiae]
MATPNERLLYAAKNDAAEMLTAVLEGQEEFDVNWQDGLGNTALHYAASSPSPEALGILLDTDGTDVDLQNRLERATPLHLAVKLENEAARQGVIEMLLDAGADPNIKDRHSLRVQDYLRPDSSPVDKDILRAIREALADRTRGSVANNADLVDDDDDGEPGSGSGSDED